jgi:hypothetical protein
MSPQLAQLLNIVMVQCGMVGFIFNFEMQKLFSSAKHVKRTKGLFTYKVKHAALTKVSYVS